VLAREIHVTKAVGAQALAVKAFELPARRSLCPYHYEYDEERLVVLDGSVLVPTPEGEETLARAIGETGFEPATARPPAGGMGCRSVDGARVCWGVGL
jgi:hypothetical protein